MGHRRILCVSDNDICVDKDRMDGCLAGVLAAAQASGCAAQTDRLQVPMSRRERLRFYEEQLPVIRRYTAVFVVSDAYAVELLCFMQQHRIRVPEEISVVGFDDTVLSRNCYPALTTVGQDAKGRAKAAVQALRELREGSLENPVRRLPVELVRRESVAEVNR